MTAVPPECASARTLLAAVVDFEATELEAARLRRHLESCPACAAIFADHERIARAIRSEPLLRPRRPALALTARWRRALVAGVLVAIVVGVVIWTATSAA